MKELLFILDYYAPHRGGIETVFENIILRLLQKGYRITLITSHFDKKLKEQEQRENLTIYRVGKGRKEFFFQSFWKGIEILKTNKNIEVIHSSTYTSALPASILGMIFKKKRILTVHEIFWELRKEFKPRYSCWIYQLFEWLSFIFPHEIYHCVSLYTLNSLRIHCGIRDERLQLIYNGVDGDFWDKEKVKEKDIMKWKKRYWWEDKYLMLYYGHSGITKGIDALVDALPEILKQNLDGILIFNLIDAKRDKEIRKRILQQAKRSWSPERIVLFDGWEKEELRELIACVDVILAPSLAEGFGSVHSEACAMDKPLITTQVAAIPEVVSGKIIFIQPRNSEEIVHALTQVREGIVKEIPKKVFNRKTSVEQIEQLYLK